MRVVWLFLFLLLITFFTPPEVMAASCETRASWISDGPIMENNIDTMISDLKNANFNTVFVMAPAVPVRLAKCATNIGVSSQYPYGQNEGSSGYDYGIEGYKPFFTSFIQKAKANGFSVHAWLLNKMRDGSNQVDFTNLDEQDCQADWAQNTLDIYGQYLDGIHLDYIRYENWTNVNVSNHMTGVSATVQKIDNAIKAKYPAKKLSAAVFSSNPQYADPSKEWPKVPAWYVGWFNANPNNRYSSAYKDFTTTVPEGMKFQQDAVGWVAAGAIDAIAPMEYTMVDTDYGDPDIPATETMTPGWNNETQSWVNHLTYATGNPNNLIEGLGWLASESAGDNWGYDAPGIVRKINYGRSIGVTGFAVFRYTAIAKDAQLLSALKSGPFSAAAPACFAENVRTKKIGIADFRSLLNVFSSILPYNSLLAAYGQ